jgi:hypothetical protein
LARHHAATQQGGHTPSGPCCEQTLALQLRPTCLQAPGGHSHRQHPESVAATFAGNSGRGRDGHLVASSLLLSLQASPCGHHNCHQAWYRSFRNGCNVAATNSNGCSIAMLCIPRATSSTARFLWLSVTITTCQCRQAGNIKGSDQCELGYHQLTAAVS